ncbi:hypothetical protein SUGI_0461140 [Cryptomeria japonica]|nr:hypothetical protein SUGI_0461140 [Cryptomeria japonica]
MRKHVMKVNLMRERQRQHLSNNLNVDLDNLATTIDSIEEGFPNNVSDHLVINYSDGIIDNENSQLLEDYSMHAQTIDNRDEHAMKEMKLHVTHKLHNLQGILTHATDLATFTFIDKHLEDLSNKVKSKHISSQLGLDHPSAHPFHPVQDGFGHTVRRQRDLIECMNMRRRPKGSRLHAADSRLFTEPPCSLESSRLPIGNDQHLTESPNFLQDDSHLPRNLEGVAASWFSSVPSTGVAFMPPRPARDSLGHTVEAVVFSSRFGSQGEIPGRADFIVDFIAVNLVLRNPDLLGFKSVLHGRI